MAGRQNWRTPKWLFDRLTAEFGPFVLDAAASAENALCDLYYDVEQDGLVRPWRNTTFCNPPFAQVGDWVAKAAHEATVRMVSSVVLVPAVCSQAWWHACGVDCVAYMPTKRLRFDQPDGSPSRSADRDTIILVFGPRNERDHNVDFDARPWRV